MTPSPREAPSADGARAAPARPDRRVAAALALLAVVLALRTAAVVPISRLMLDDGFYYLRIAQNLVAGLGSTWNGLHPTNGYHPLWLLALVPLTWTVSDPDAALAAVYAVESVLLAVSVALVYLACHRAADRWSASRWSASRWIAGLGAVLWLGLTYRWFWSGMEYALQTTVLLVSMAVYPRWRQRPLAFGALLAVAFLARLDTLLLAVVIAVAGVVGSRPAVSRKAWLLRLSIPVALVALADLTVNGLLFGHPLPVSGTVKGDWSRHLLEQDPLFERHGWLVAKAVHVVWPARSFPGPWSLALAAGTIGIAAATGIATRWRPGGALDRALRPFAPFSVFSVLSFLTFAIAYHGRWSQSSWYFAIQPILAAVLFSALAAAAARRLARPKVVAALAALAILAAGARLFGGIGQSQPAAGRGIEPVLAAVATLPAEALLASWNGGAIGYLSGRPIVALDGLANSWAYARSQRHDLCGYWRATGITHLVDAFRFEDGRPVQPVYPGDPGYSDYAACAARLHPVWMGEARGSVRMAILELRG